MNRATAPDKPGSRMVKAHGCIISYTGCLILWVSQFQTEIAHSTRGSGVHRIVFMMIASGHPPSS